LLRISTHFSLNNQLFIGCHQQEHGITNGFEELVAMTVDIMAAAGAKTGCLPLVHRPGVDPLMMSISQTILILDGRFNFFHSFHFYSGRSQ